MTLLSNCRRCFCENIRMLIIFAIALLFRVCVLSILNDEHDSKMLNWLSVDHLSGDYSLFFVVGILTQLSWVMNWVHFSCVRFIDIFIIHSDTSSPQDARTQALCSSCKTYRSYRAGSAADEAIDATAMKMGNVTQPIVYTDGKVTSGKAIPREKRDQRKCMVVLLPAYTFSCCSAQSWRLFRCDDKHQWYNNKIISS